MLDSKKKSPQVIVRDCTLADAGVIAEIYNESILAGDCTMDDQPKSEAEIRQSIQGFSKRETILILEDEDGVQGWGIIKKYSDRSGYRFCCETAVYLRRNRTGRGYGTKLKQALIQRCKDFGYHHMVAKIFADNKTSIRYNQKLGYEIVGRQREIGYKNGKWQDVVIMQFILADVPPEISAGDS
ncbi:MAG: GNAT family N-acetyltransferase [bacterium]